MISNLCLLLFHYDIDFMKRLLGFIMLACLACSCTSEASYMRIFKYQEGEMSEYYNTFSACWEYVGSEAYMVHLNGQYYLGVGYYDGYDYGLLVDIRDAETAMAWIENAYALAQASEGETIVLDDPQVFKPLMYDTRKGTRQYYVNKNNSLSETTVYRNGNGKFQEMAIDFEYGIIELDPQDYRCMMAAFKSINVMKEKLDDFIYSK